jgi:hypothetical protein
LATILCGPEGPYQEDSDGNPSGNTFNYLSIKQAIRIIHSKRKDYGYRSFSASKMDLLLDYRKLDVWTMSQNSLWGVAADCLLFLKQTFGLYSEQLATLRISDVKCAVNEGKISEHLVCITL